MNLSIIFKYEFMQRALLVGTMISLASAMLGVTLVLKRYAMMGDGLSHVAFGALAIALALGFSPLVVSVPVVVLAAFLLLYLNSKGKVPGDAALGMISSGALALGVLITSLTSGLSADINNYMFGSVLAINDFYVIASIVISLGVLLLFILFHGRIFSVTFDESFSRASGVSVNGINIVVGLFTALTIVVGMKIMGALLISSLIVFPAITAMRLCKSFKGVVITAGILSVIGFVCGLILSYIWQAPTGATVVIVHIILFTFSLFISLYKNRKKSEMFFKKRTNQD